MALTLTAGAIYWFKSLEYHWFSTMYGVWYFANCMRGALSMGVLLMLWLYNRGDFKGILKTDHLWAIGQLMLTFTVFWAYISFSQYFLIWNANVPEETFWYNIREFGDWWYVSLFLVFGNFLLPFLLLLSYRYKVTHRTIRRIAYLVLFVIFVDISLQHPPGAEGRCGQPAALLLAEPRLGPHVGGRRRRHLHRRLPPRPSENEADPDPRPADRRMPAPQ